MWLIGSVLYVVSAAVTAAPIIGLCAVLLLFGYFCATFFTIVQSTAVGDGDAPEFPNITGLWDDLVWPTVQVVLVFLVSFSPFIVCSIWAGGVGSLLSNALLILGGVYFPMAMLAVVVLGYTGAMSPHIVVPGIIHAGWFYWVAVVLLLLIRQLEGLLSDVLGASMILGAIVMSIASMYVLMTSGRILGLVYRNKEDELGWL